MLYAQYEVIRDVDGSFHRIEPIVIGVCYRTTKPSGWVQVINRTPVALIDDILETKDFLKFLLTVLKLKCGA